MSVTSEAATWPPFNEADLPCDIKPWQAVEMLKAVEAGGKEASVACQVELAPYSDEEVLNFFGPHWLIWRSMLPTNTSDLNGQIRSVSNLPGVNRGALRTSFIWHEEASLVSKASDVTAQYLLMDALQKELPSQLDLPNLLVVNTQAGVELKPQRLDDYSLSYIRLPAYNALSGSYAEGWYNHIHTIDGNEYSIWLNAPSGILLNYKDVPNAVVSFASSADELTIHQIQGVRAIKNGSRALTHSRGLAPFNWTHLMAGVAESVARELGIPNVGILSSVNVISNGANRQMGIPRAIKTYDETAQALGYQKGADNNWHKPII